MNKDISSLVRLFELRTPNDCGMFPEIGDRGEKIESLLESAYFVFPFGIFEFKAVVDEVAALAASTAD